MKTIRLTISLVIAFAASAVFAERPAHHAGHAHKHAVHSNANHDPHHHGHGHYQHYPSRGYYGHGYALYRHATTSTEGRLRGVAAVLRAQGQRNLLDSEAARRFEDAERLELDNAVKRVETRYKKQQINRAATHKDTLAKAAARRQRIANGARPDRLGPTKYRADLGLLNWPSMLRDGHFAETRGSIDKLVSRGVTAMSVNGSQIHRLANQMTDSMGAKIHDFTPHEYAAASQFLKSLQYEAQLALRGDASPVMAIASR